MQEVTGDWEFTLPVTVPAAVVAIDHPTGRLAGVDVRVRAVGGDPSLIGVAVETNGADGGQLSGLRSVLAGHKPGQPLPTPRADEVLTIQVADAAGRPLQRVTQSGGAKSKTGAGATDISWNSYWAGSGPGRYRVVITYRGERMESSFTIQ
jgi:hypothetical protein